MLVAHGVMTGFVTQLFEAAGLAAADAALAAGVFVLQEMRGIHTHGLRRIERNLAWLREGRMNPRPDRRVLSDRGATVVLDGDHGIGLAGCMDAMDRAVAKARGHGIGIGIVINSNHFLAAAPYCLRAADQGLVGLAFSNTYASMGYPGAAGRVVGNGPLGFAAPTAAGFPLVFDAALSASYGRLTQWLRSGQPIPPDLPAVDAEGRPTRDPAAVLEGGTPMPIGLHKGAGLVLLIEILTGILGGGAFLSQILAPERRASKADAESQCCIAIDIGHFMPVPEFLDRMAAFVEDLKRQPKAGDGEIHVPGERACQSLETTRREGIPLPPDLADELRRLAREAGLAAPF